MRERDLFLQEKREGKRGVCLPGWQRIRCGGQGGKASLAHTFRKESIVC